MRKALILAPLAALSMTACGDNSAGTNQAAADNMVAENIAADEAAMAGDNAMMNGAAPAAMPATAQEFADKAAASDMYEIESSKLAEGKAQDAKVKAFAAMLVKDHTKSTADLKAAAAKASPAITPAGAMDAEQQANIAALQAASGADFDRLYLQQQVPAHQKALDMLQAYAANGEVAPFKDFASKVAPVVERHLTEAKAMAK